MSQGLLSTSGGLVYHLRALRHRHRAWRPFRDELGRWIAAWTPPCARLVLIGPSAGHTLPEALFTRFAEIVAIEPDPLARHLLARRAPPALRFERREALASAEALAALAAAHPGAAFLFCNLLGQVEAPAGQRWAELLARSFDAQHWASFHDVVSTAVAPRPGAAPCRCEAASLEAVLEHFWPGGELPLRDHETFRLAGPGAASYALWPLARGRYHLIEWVTHAPRGPA